jgi:DNA-binding cell septation regulator SpoVG
MQDKKPEAKNDSVKLQHTHKYFGGPYSYKNSSKIERDKQVGLDPEKIHEMVLMTRPGQISRISIALPEEDARAGAYPQHNTVFYINETDEEIDEDEIMPSTIDHEDYQNNLELVHAKDLSPYLHLKDVVSLKNAGFEKRICSMTKTRLAKIKAQFSHFSDLAFNQMLDITRPDKRDFVVWYKIIQAKSLVMIAYPNEKTKQTNFVQIIHYDKNKRIDGIKHCVFDNGTPMVINETLIDKFKNIRQISHLGKKGSSSAINSVERFDDGTVSWIISNEKENGAACLMNSGEIVFVQSILNSATELAARNLGAEGCDNGKWTGVFDLSACKSNGNPVQDAFKTKVREQISNIVDGSSIPGLDPIFWI